MASGCACCSPPNASSLLPPAAVITSRYSVFLRGADSLESLASPFIVCTRYAMKGTSVGQRRPGFPMAAVMVRSMTSFSNSCGSE